MVNRLAPASRRRLAPALCALALAIAGAAQVETIPANGRPGGQLVVPLASAPQTFNPLFAPADAASNQIAEFTQADLMHINPRTLRVEPALATSVDHPSPTRWIIHLRRGVQFSDGSPFTSADVVYSFGVYTDAKLDAPGRQLLLLGGQPVRCRALDPYTAELDLPEPDPVGDRLFDSVWMLPRAKFRPDGWKLGTAPADLAGLGPFMVVSVAPGREVVLARNPHYWRQDSQRRRLPYLDTVHLREVADPNLRLTLFARGQLDGLQTVSPADFTRLAASPCCRLLDAGAGLNSEDLVLNQSPRGPSWFRQAAFRQALSLALDRANLVRNVYGGHAHALASVTSPGDGVWADPTPPPAQNLARARALLAGLGYHRDGARLLDASGRPIAFSLIVPSTNAARRQIAVFLQEDLRKLGIAVAVVPLDFATYVDKLLHGSAFDAALVGIQIPDADPNVESNLWPLDAPWHFWNPSPAHPSGWERDLDRLFHAQQAAGAPAARLRDYRALQAIERAQLPLVPLVAPDILVGAKPGLQGVDPGLLPPQLWWNVDRLYWPGPVS